APGPGERAGAADVLAAFSAAPPQDDAGGRAREPFAGRADELAHLRARLDAVGETGAVALIRGRAGIGKTSLVRAFEHQGRAAGVLFFSGRCYEAESVPFKGVDALVDAVSEHLRRLPAL